MLRILVSVSDFADAQLARIRQAVDGRAAVTVIPQDAPEPAYRQALQTSDVVVGWPRPEWLDGTPVQLLQIGSSGWDSYRALEGRAISLCTARGVYSVGVAEHAVALMMALVRRLPTFVHDKDGRQFRRHSPHPSEIAGSRALVVGLGSIGDEVAKRCKGLGMTVTALVTREREAPDWVDAIRSVENLKEAVGEADHLFLTLPGGAETELLFSREILAACRPSAYVYNVSRGSVIDETALYECLRDGRLAGAGLDVTATEPLPADSPLWTLGDNVLITGHSAGLSTGFPERFCALVVRNLTHYLSAQPLENQVLYSYDNH